MKMIITRMIITFLLKKTKRLRLVACGAIHVLFLLHYCNTTVLLCVGFYLSAHVLIFFFAYILNYGKTNELKKMPACIDLCIHVHFLRSSLIYPITYSIPVQVSSIFGSDRYIS